MSLPLSKNPVTAFFVGLFLLAVSSSVSGQQFYAPTGTVGGPGTEMTQIINRLGLGSNCGRCQALASEMDRNGPAWVMQNRNYVAERTISNAENLGHRMGPLRRAGVRAIIRTSVRRTR